MTLWTTIKGFFWYVFKFKDNKTDMNEVMEQLNEPYKVQAFLTFCIKYTKDEHPEDHWQSLEKTFEKRRVDCEEYSMWADACLRNEDGSQRGIILCMYKSGSGHATFLLPDLKNDRYISLGTFGLMYHKYDRNKNPNFNICLIENIKTWLRRWGYEDWTSFRFCDPTGKTLSRVYRS